MASKVQRDRDRVLRRLSRLQSLALKYRWRLARLDELLTP
jgi:hypothetical protein